jgi:hypothetical protein
VGNKQTFLWLAREFNFIAQNKLFDVSFLKQNRPHVFWH